MCVNDTHFLGVESKVELSTRMVSPFGDECQSRRKLRAKKSERTILVSARDATLMWMGTEKKKAEVWKECVYVGW